MANYPNPLNTKLDANQVLIRSYDEDNNRLRVDAEVSATIGNVSVIIDAASGDNIKISDGVDTLSVNADGSINVNVQDITISHTNDSIALGNGVSTIATITTVGAKNGLDVNVINNPDEGINKSNFNSIVNINSNIETTITSYTVPAGKTAKLFNSEVSGTNAATYTMYVNSSAISKTRTYYTQFNSQMSFTNGGYLLTSGDVVTIKVIHQRPSQGDFDANIQIRESI